MRRENNMKKCPVCKINELHKEEVMNALSRKDNKTYICSSCALGEAMEELEKLDRDYPDIDIDLK
jgi:hypothetical protein